MRGGHGRVRWTCPWPYRQHGHGTQTVFKFFSWVIGLPVIVYAVIFAINNQDAMGLDFWPFPYTPSWPVFWVVLGSLLIGCILGMFLTWLAQGKYRQQARSYRSQAISLRTEADLAKARAEAAESKAAA